MGHHTLWDVHMTYATTPTPGPPTAPPLHTFTLVPPENGVVPTAGGVVEMEHEEGRCGLDDVGFKRQNEVF